MKIFSQVLSEVYACIKSSAHLAAFLKTARPDFTKFYMKSSFEEELKVLSNGHTPLTKMAAMIVAGIMVSHWT